MTAATIETTTTMPVSHFLYQVTMRHTSFADYGYGVEDIARGLPVPLSGARIDIGFEGVIEGPRLRGTVVGMDYGTLRADGRFELCIHATITTDDGARIAFYADGIYRPEDGAVRENVTLTTAAPDYAWINQLQVWATGFADVIDRVIEMKGYAA